MEVLCNTVMMCIILFIIDMNVCIINKCLNAPKCCMHACIQPCNQSGVKLNQQWLLTAKHHKLL